MDKNTRTIATKVTAEEFATLGKFLKRKGMTLYELLRAAVVFLIRSTDKPHGLTVEEEAAIQEFNEVIDAKHLIVAPLPGQKLKCEEATYYMNNENGKGVIGAHVLRPFFGERTITYNVQYIVDKPLCMLEPELYMSLRRKAAEFGCTSVVETIRHLIIESDDSIRAHEIDELFADNDRHEWGKSQQDIRKYKGHYNKEMK